MELVRMFMFWLVDGIFYLKKRVAPKWEGNFDYILYYFYV